MPTEPDKRLVVNWTTPRGNRVKVAVECHTPDRAIQIYGVQWWRDWKVVRVEEDKRSYSDLVGWQFSVQSDSEAHAWWGGLYRQILLAVNRHVRAVQERENA